MKHIFSVFCNRAITDKDRNVVSLEGVIESLIVTVEKIEPIEGTSKLPIIADLFSYWMREAESETKVEGAVAVFDPQGKELGRHPVTREFGNFKRVRTRIEMRGFPYTVNGQYWIKLYEHDRQVAEIPFDITLKLNEATVAAGPTGPIEPFDPTNPVEPVGSGPIGPTGPVERFGPGGGPNGPAGPA